jgi:phage FluMu protein Com
MWRDLRCLGPFRRPGGSGVCGQLLLRMGDGMIEIKCPRCHHLRLLRWDGWMSEPTVVLLETT